MAIVKRRNRNRSGPLSPPRSNADEPLSPSKMLKKSNSKNTVYTVPDEEIKRVKSTRKWTIGIVSLYKNPVQNGMIMQVAEESYKTKYLELYIEYVAFMKEKQSIKHYFKHEVLHDLKLVYKEVWKERIRKRYAVKWHTTTFQLPSSAILTTGDTFASSEEYLSSPSSSSSGDTLLEDGWSQDGLLTELRLPLEL